MDEAVTCRHCGRISPRDATMRPVPVPGMRFEYECADYQECIDRVVVSLTWHRAES